MKKYRLSISILILVLLAIYGLVNIWKDSTLKKVQSMYPIEKSSNKEASAEFLKAMEYRIYIKELHPFFDYDSFIIAPLLEKLDYHFQRGKALLPKDSVEDIVWWTLFYKEIHALLGAPRNDNSLAFENLPTDKFRKIHDQIYEMIMRYPTGVVNFKIDEIKKFRFQTMAILSGFYYKEFILRYKANTMLQKDKLANKDGKLKKLLFNVKEKYKLAYEKFIDDSKNKEFMKHEYFFDIISINTRLIVNYTIINKTQKLPYSICYSEDNRLILDNVDILIDLVKNSNTPQAKIAYTSLFSYKEITNVPIVFKMLHYRCPNLRPKVTEVVKKIDELNKIKK